MFCLLFLFIGWYHLEERVLAALAKSADKVETFEANLNRVVFTPDVYYPTGAGGRGSGWALSPGKHDLYFNGHDRIVFPYEMGEFMRRLPVNTTYVVEVQPWGSQYWRWIRNQLPTAAREVLNIRDQAPPDYLVLTSLRKDGETIVEPATTISYARAGIPFGIFLTLFFGGIGLFFAAGVAYSLVEGPLGVGPRP